MVRLHAPSPTTPTPSPTPAVVAGVFDAPTGTEWSDFWSRPWPVRVYNAAVVVAALATMLGAGALGPVGWGDVAAVVALSVSGMISGELGRLAEGSRVERQRIHKGLSAWALAAGLLLGPGLAGWVAAAVYAHAWARGVRITLWKWVGSCAMVALAALAAHATMVQVTGGTLPLHGSIATFAGVVAAVVVFLAAESGLLFVISRLNTQVDEVYLRAMLARPSFYVVELGVLASGALIAVLFRYHAAFLLLAGPANLLIQRGLLHEPLRHEARHDAKTGLLNSEAWRSTAASALAQCRREGRPAAVLIVDVDHFKAVNDTYGHLAGDDVLARAADAILGCLRRTDVVGRFGGDEFCVLLSCGTPEEAAAAAERICARIGRLGFATPGLHVTASVGVAVADAAVVTADLPWLVANADQALYEAKTAGRDRVCIRAA